MGQEKGALVKKLLKLKASGNDEIYDVAVSLAGPAVAAAVDRAMSSGTKKQKLDDKKPDAAIEVEVEEAQPSKRPESAASQQTLKAAELLNPLDQGSFGLCSEFALATAVSNVLKLKYHFCFSSELILTTWLAVMVPSKAAWPDAMASNIGSFKMHSPDTIYEFSLRVAEKRTNFTAVCQLVHAFAGFATIVIVAALERGNHSMTAVRWCFSDGALLCLNSWGCLTEPFVKVTEATFIKAYTVDVAICQTWTPAEKVIVKQATNIDESAEWSFMAKKWRM